MAAKRRKSAPARKPSRPARPTRARAQAVDEWAEKPGMPFEAVVPLVTFLLLIVALGLVEYEKGVHYGAGMFSGSYAGATEG